MQDQIHATDRNHRSCHQYQPAALRNKSVHGSQRSASYEDHRLRKESPSPIFSGVTSPGGEGDGRNLKQITNDLANIVKIEN